MRCVHSFSLGRFVNQRRIRLWRFRYLLLFISWANRCCLTGWGLRGPSEVYRWTCGSEITIYRFTRSLRRWYVNHTFDLVRSRSIVSEIRFRLDVGIRDTESRARIELQTGRRERRSMLRSTVSAFEIYLRAEDLLGIHHESSISDGIHRWFQSVRCRQDQTGEFIFKRSRYASGWSYGFSNLPFGLCPRWSTCKRTFLCRELDYHGSLLSLF